MYNGPQLNKQNRKAIMFFNALEVLGAWVMNVFGGGMSYGPASHGTTTGQVSPKVPDSPESPESEPTTMGEDLRLNAYLHEMLNRANTDEKRAAVLEWARSKIPDTCWHDDNQFENVAQAIYAYAMVQADTAAYAYTKAINGDTYDTYQVYQAARLSVVESMANRVDFMMSQYDENS